MLSLVLAAVATQMASTRLNRDTYFHLRLGEEFLDGWEARSPESVTRYATAEWTPTQWLGQVAMAAAERAGGLTAVAFVAALAAIALMLCFYLAARRHASVPVAAILLPVALIGTVSATSARPQILSLMAITLITSAWLATARTGRTPWWIVPLTWLWAMTHGMWISGVLISAVACAGLFLDRPRDLRSAGRHLAVPVLSFVAALATPLGPDVVSALARVGGITSYFQEWSSPALLSPGSLAGALLLTVVVVVAVRASWKLDWTTVLLTLLAAAWLFYTVRTVAVATAMLVPLAAAALSHGRTRQPWSRAERWCVPGAVALAIALASITVTAQPSFDRHRDSAAHSSIAQLPPGAGVLNEWGEGGYDMWRHHALAFVQHGYGDMFTEPELRRNVTLFSLDPGWYAEVEGTGVTDALLYVDSRLTAALEEKGWVVVAVDSTEIPQDERLTHLRAPG